MPKHSFTGALVRPESGFRRAAQLLDGPLHRMHGERRFSPMSLRIVDIGFELAVRHDAVDQPQASASGAVNMRPVKKISFAKEGPTTSISVLMPAAR